MKQRKELQDVRTTATPTNAASVLEARLRGRVSWM